MTKEEIIKIEKDKIKPVSIEGDAVLRGEIASANSHLPDLIFYPCLHPPALTHPYLSSYCHLCGKERIMLKKVDEDDEHYIYKEVKKFVSTGGRHYTIYALTDNQDYEIISAKGHYHTPADDLLVIENAGQLKILRAYVLWETEATVHGSWKLRKHQTLIIYEKLNLPPKYKVADFSDGSYVGITYKIVELETGKIIDARLSERYVLIDRNEIDFAEKELEHFIRLGRYIGDDDKNKNKNIYILKDRNELKSLSDDECYIARIRPKALSVFAKMRYKFI